MNRGALVTVLVAFSIFVGATAGVWVWLSGTDVEWAPRTPAEVPVWLTPGPVEIQVSQRWSLDLPHYALQWFRPNKSQLNSLPWLLLGQVQAELDIDTEGKEPVAVDGVQGWLWHLGPEDLLAVERAEDRPPEERSGECQVYRVIRDHRRPEKPGVVRADGTVELGVPAGILAGPAIAIQWNRDGVHHVLVGQDREPLTVDVLLGMANSMQMAISLEQH